MARRNRAEVVVADEVGVYHCVQRVVRRAFLCGLDPLSGNSYDHRKAWIRDRLESLAGLYGLEIAAFAEMSNHLHVILRIRPDVVALWSDQEVARRRLALFPGARRASDHGLLPMTLESYLTLLDWTGRQLRAGTKGVIPPELTSILDRLQVSAESWLETVARFGRRFHRAAGLADHLKAEAQRLGVTWLHGLRWSQVAFAPPCR